MKTREFVDKYLSLLQHSTRPVILVGRGVRASGSVDLFREFINKYQIPVVCSLLGLDVLPYNHPLRAGFIGIYGNRWANYALGNSDLLLVLGSRLDSRQTGERTSFANRLIYHVDIAEEELNNSIKGCMTLQTDLADFLKEINDVDSSYENKGWLCEIINEEINGLDVTELSSCKGINPNVFIHELSKASKGAFAFTADVGSNQMWTAQSLELTDDQLFLTSGGMGAMGYSLPAAIGASISRINAPVVCICGDGGFQINIQELQTIARNNLPIKIVILNNHCLGMIRQFQDAYFESRYQSTVLDYSAPNFTSIALAYDINTSAISRPEDIEHGLFQLWQYPTNPFLLDVTIDVHTNIRPKVMFGNPLTKMD